MATNTYIALDKVTVSSNTSSVTLSSIPQGYTDLVLVAAVKDSNNYTGMRINGDTGSNYSRNILTWNGSSTGSSRTASANTLYIGGNDTNPEISIYNFQNYSNTTTYKAILGTQKIANATSLAASALWHSTAAITSINIYSVSGSTILAGSTFSLYGIKAEGASPAAKATGGTITYSSDGYTYHTFLSSGTFTPSQALTCDYLVVAGGGGGGATSGGGGGAGGLRSTVGATGGGGTLESPLALTSGTGYTVTIGAGGAGGSGGQNVGNSGAAGSNSVFASITSTGGGAGGGNTKAPTTGGSGGGTAAEWASGPYAGTANQGFAGGNRYALGSANGGGGGAGAVGQTPTTYSSGAGGAGVAISAFASATGTGVNYYYAGGGGAGGRTIDGQANPGVGGAGGGGAGKVGNAVTGGAGVANTGGGGGGSDYYAPSESTQGAGGAGGSGIVIIRYASV